MHFAIKAHLRTLDTAQRVERSLWEIAGAILGGLAGAKILNWIENWHALTSASPDMPAGFERWLGGKTIVGGLIGGWIGVEIAKHFLKIKQRTGDLWVYPLAISIAIGRVGCFLTGLSDQTYGTPTSLPWAVDFGDGIPRHPTQLYEIIALLLIAGGLFIYQRITKIGYTTGRLFRMFMFLYCLWRFCVEFIKPTDKPYAGVSAIQLACAITCVVCLVSLYRSRQRAARPALVMP
jgi:prolipoprotein diacylglyceryltransferase